MWKKDLIKRILSSIILFPVVIFIILKGSYLFNFFLVVCFVTVIFEWHKMIKKKNYYYYLGIIFLFFSFYSVYELNRMNNNYTTFLFILLICISTDIGGFFFGKLFKGPKLTSISPNKTYSGAIGSLLFSILFTFYFFKIAYLFPEKTNISFSTYFLAILISLVSQIGDIVISYFKRLSKIKDTGKIIPGHGGLLDRTDGMIFAFPFAYIILSSNLFGAF